jgi:predicted transcriptional regulator
MKPRKTAAITIRITESMKDACQRVADVERRSVSQVVVIALETFLESRREWPPSKPKRQPTTRPR